MEIDIEDLIEDPWSQEWTDDEFDVARWEHEDRDLAINVNEWGDGKLQIVLSRQVTIGGYRAEIPTVTLYGRTIEEASSAVERLMTEIEGGVGDVVAIGAEEEEIGEETFVHFYCVFESTLPEGVSPDDLAFEDDVGDEAIETVSAFDLDEDEYEDDGIRVEVYPVHESEVSFDE